MRQLASTEQHPSSMATLKRLLGYIKDRKGGLGLPLLSWAWFVSVELVPSYRITL